VVIWYIFSVLVCLDQEKSGNPGREMTSHVTGMRGHSHCGENQVPFSDVKASMVLLAVHVDRVARVFLVQHIKKGKKYTKSPQNIPNAHNIYQMSLKYTKMTVI
jgi:hypothetical protein